MKFNLKTTQVNQTKVDCLVIGLHKNSNDELSSTIGAHVIETLRKNQLENSGDHAILNSSDSFAADTVIVVWLEKELQELPAAVVADIKRMRCTSIAIDIDTLDYSSQQEDRTEKLTQLLRLTTERLADSLYVTKKQPQGTDKEVKNALKDVEFLCSDKSLEKVLKLHLKLAEATILGKEFARDVSNLPGNVCTPTYLAEQAKNVSKPYPIKTHALNEKEMAELGMHSLLSVSRGSRQPAKLIVMEYSGAKNKKDQPYVLVGKGLTFDAGGISIKPAGKMDEMKYDMCGAASVIGTLLAVAELELPINVVVVVPSSENLPDGDANKPGDVVTSMSGQTIEILNTDAEGRLILCDALTYAERFNPETIIDVATLTGACIVALGSHTNGLMGNDQDLIDDLLTAGQESADRAWQLPLWDTYQKQLQSNFADIANIGTPGAGTITAACFLSRFTEKYRWAHLDIAGTAWQGGANKGATGRCVPLLTQYLFNKATNK